MDIDQIISKVKNHPQEKVRVTICDIDGVLRGKVMSKDKFLSAAKSGFGFCDVVFGWDAADVAYDNGQATGWHSGYPDAPAQIDLSTFREVPWMDNLPFFLCDFDVEGGSARSVCPRTLLKSIDAKCQEMGMKPMLSMEFEFFHFAETAQTIHEKGFQNLKPLTPGMFGYSLQRSSENHDYFTDLFDLLLQFGVPIEGLHTETGPGVYEAAITYSDVLEAADRAVLFKSAVKEIATKHGITATFMAKINMELPGCSGHVHQSLWNAEGSQNLFFDADDEQGISETFRHYMAGQLKCLPYVLPFFAPTINSFKRLVEGAWAPTTITWACDNRTTALRALPGSEKSSRLETRVVGSDANPYLAMAAALGSGLYGIENKIPLDQPATKGNGYQDFSNGTLPPNLWEATQKMKNSEVAATIFGSDFIDHFARTREWEWRQFAQTVTDWELKRYLEII